MGKTALEKANLGASNAGRGPFEVGPGETSGVLVRVNGDVDKGRNMALLISVHDEPDSASTFGLGPQGGDGVQLVGLLRVSQDGKTPQTIEIDVCHGTVITCPGAFVELAIRNDAPTGNGPGQISLADKVRNVSACVVDGTFFKDGNATRTIQNIEAVVSGGQGTPVNIPPAAIAVGLYVDVIENPFDKVIQFYDAFSNLVAQTRADQPYVRIPNQAAYVVFSNEQFTQSDRHSFVFELAF